MKVYIVKIGWSDVPSLHRLGVIELLSPKEHDLPSHLPSPGMEMTVCTQKAEEMYLCEQVFSFPLQSWQNINYSENSALWEEIWSQ